MDQILGDGRYEGRSSKRHHENQKSSRSYYQTSLRPPGDDSYEEEGEGYYERSGSSKWCPSGHTAKSSCIEDRGQTIKEEYVEDYDPLRRNLHKEEGRDGGSWISCLSHENVPLRNRIKDRQATSTRSSDNCEAVYPVKNVYPVKTLYPVKSVHPVKTVYPVKDVNSVKVKQEIEYEPQPFAGPQEYANGRSVPTNKRKNREYDHDHGSYGAFKGYDSDVGNVHKENLSRSTGEKNSVPTRDSSCDRPCVEIKKRRDDTREICVSAKNELVNHKHKNSAENSGDFSNHKTFSSKIEKSSMHSAVQQGLDPEKGKGQHSQQQQQPQQQPRPLTKEKQHQQQVQQQQQHQQQQHQHEQQQEQQHHRKQEQQGQQQEQQQQQQLPRLSQQEKDDKLQQWRQQQQQQWRQQFQQQEEDQSEQLQLKQSLETPPQQEEQAIPDLPTLLKQIQENTIQQVEQGKMKQRQTHQHQAQQQQQKRLPVVNMPLSRDLLAPPVLRHPLLRGVILPRVVQSPQQLPPRVVQLSPGQLPPRVVQLPQGQHPPRVVQPSPGQLPPRVVQLSPGQQLPRVVQPSLGPLRPRVVQILPGQVRPFAGPGSRGPSVLPPQLSGPRPSIQSKATTPPEDGDTPRLFGFGIEASVARPPWEKSTKTLPDQTSTLQGKVSVSNVLPKAPWEDEAKETSPVARPLSGTPATPPVVRPMSNALLAPRLAYHKEPVTLMRPFFVAPPINCKPLPFSIIRPGGVSVNCVPAQPAVLNEKKLVLPTPIELAEKSQSVSINGAIIPLFPELIEAMKEMKRNMFSNMISNPTSSDTAVEDELSKIKEGNDFIPHGTLVELAKKTGVGSRSKLKEAHRRQYKMWFDEDCRLMYKLMQTIFRKKKSLRKAGKRKEAQKVFQACKKMKNAYTALLHSKKKAYTEKLEEEGNIEAVCMITLSYVVDRVCYEMKGYQHKNWKGKVYSTKDNDHISDEEEETNFDEGEGEG